MRVFWVVAIVISLEVLPAGVSAQPARADAGAIAVARGEDLKARALEILGRAETELLYSANDIRALTETIREKVTAGVRLVLTVPGATAQSRTVPIEADADADAVDGASRIVRDLADERMASAREFSFFREQIRKVDPLRVIDLVDRLPPRIRAMLDPDQDTATLSLAPGAELRQPDGTVLSAPQPAVVGLGMTRTVDYPAVGMLLVEQDRQRLTCTASLVHERAMLTAAHCFCGATSFATCPMLSSTADRDETVRGSRVYLAHAGVFGLADVIVHPGFAWGGSPSGDLALLILKDAVDGVTPLPLRTGAPLAVGAKVTLIGYGFSRAPIGSDQDLRFLGVKNEGRNSIEACDRPGDLLCWRLADHPQQASICQGDSGGPVLEEGSTTRIAGVVSATIKGCKAGDQPLSMDVTKFESWIRGELGKLAGLPVGGPLPELQHRGNSFAYAVRSKTFGSAPRLSDTFFVPQGKALLRMGVNASISGQSLSVRICPAGRPDACQVSGAEDSPIVLGFPLPTDRFEVEVTGAVNQTIQIVATAF